MAKREGHGLARRTWLSEKVVAWQQYNRCGLVRC